MTWQVVSMERMLLRLQQDFPDISFTSGKVLHWSPNTCTIFYNENPTTEDLWGLLHEVGHAIFEHKNYTSDMDLLKKEIAAWKKAYEVSGKYQLQIDQEHIEACLDTYRDWLHKRSTCPACRSHGIEQHTGLYRCLNCKTTWEVTPSRFCRPYRRIRNQIQK